MPGLVLRLWVLSLAIWFQASSWSSEACSSARIVLRLVQCGDESKGARDDSREGHPRDSDPRERAASDRDVPEDRTEELAGADDSPGNDVVPADIPDWCSPPASSCAYAWIDGLAPGGPPVDAPFKPPEPDQVPHSARLA
jgi:hypothetical protein